MLKWRVRGDMDDANPSLKTMVTPGCPPCPPVTPSTASITSRHASDSLSSLPPPPAPPNKSFLHQSFVSGSSPSVQYYDGRGSRPSLPPAPFHGPLNPASGPRYYESQGRYSLPPPTYEEPLDPTAGDPRCYNGRYSLPLATYEEPSSPTGEDSDPRYCDSKERISPPLPMYEVPRSPSRVEESVYEACPGDNDVEVRTQDGGDSGSGGGAYDAPPSHYACPGNNAAVTPHRSLDEHVQGTSRTAYDAAHITTTTTTTTTTGTNTTEQDEWRRASRSSSGSYGTGKRRPRPRYYFGTMPSIRPNCSSNSFTHYSTPKGNRPVLPRPPLPSPFLPENQDDAADPLQHYDFPKKQGVTCDPPTQGDEYEELSPYIVPREQKSAVSKDQKSHGARSNVLRRLRAFMLRDEAGKDRKASKESKKCKRTISLRKQTKEDKHKTKEKTEAHEEYQSLDLPRDNLKEALDLSVGRGCRRKEDGRPRGERWRGLFHTVREKLSPPQRPSVFWVVLTAQESGKENGETEALTEEGVSGAGGGGGDPAGGGGEGSPQKSPPPSPQPPQTQTIYHTFPRRRSRPPRPLLCTSPLTSPAIPDGAYVHLFPFMSMSALQMAAEGRDYLMWCPDQEFDNAVSALDIRGLVDLVQTLQDAMAVEQQTFDSLSQQLELVSEPLQQQRLSAALCTSQTRLARLCARNMRCFRQQALKARQRDNSESRSSSPRDSGLVVSSAAPSDTEGGDARSPTHGSFKNSLAFFQRAAHLVAANTRNAAQGYRQKDSRRRSSRGSSTYSSSGSEVWSVNSEDLTAGDLAASGGVRGDLDGDLLGYVDDQGTYEQVLFINGRPQYQDDFGSGGEESIASWSAPQFHAKLRGGNSAEVADGRRQLTSVVHTSSAVAGAPPPASQPDPECLTPSRTSYTSAGDLEHLVTLPRRKPYLNFKSVSCTADLPGVGGGLSTDFDNGSLSDFKERLGVTRGSDPTTITRAQSFKEGLNYYSSDYGNSGSTYSLSRTQSFHDGLASSGDVPDGDGGGGGSGRARLQRAPSVDEILESVKYLRAKKTMVKSTPDLASAPEPVYHSASLPRHRGTSKGKGSSRGSSGSLLGVRYNSRASDSSLYEKVPEPDYEQIHDEVDHANIAHYENFCRGNNHYENVHLKGEAIYDSPRPTDVHLLHQYDRGHADLQYENVKYDVPVYENLDGKEPTYMNVNGKAGNVYANLDGRKSATLRPSSSASSNSRSKVTISGNSTLQGTTYDVPRAATHIYDSPQRQVRSVGASTQANEYDTPRNNRSVLPQSTQIVLKAKNDQKQKIDDIFADCDKDSLDGDREKDRAPPDIPSPDYGSEEEGEGYEDASNEYVTTELPDEGLGESDSRSYYTEDPAGLEVILEEPEEEYCSSHVSEDELRRDVDITFELKCERRSLDGSEGIGSAEGDTQSSGGSEHCVEEDCASSGIHSEDTPSPGPPVDAEKEGRQGLLHKQKREEDRTQKDRCVEVYPETVRQRQRNMMAANNKVDIKNWNSSNNNNNNDTLTSPSKSKKFLPSVKALRSQFEAGKTSIGKSETNGSVTTNGSNGQTLSRKSSSSSVASISQDVASTATITSLHSPNASVENLGSPAIPEDGPGSSEPVEPIFNQFRKVDQELRELMSKPHSTSGWDPRPLLKRLYYIPEAPKIQSQGTTYVNIEGYLEKLPSGRKKATFWNAWKRRYFMAKNGILYYYQSAQTDKPSMKMTLMGGKVECMEPNMVGVDDGKGHYVVVRCSSRQEAERWRRALETHTVEDFTSQYVQPWPMPTNPTLLRDTIIVDIGSASIRAGVLASQATLPQVFIPSVVASGREGRGQVWGMDALAPDVRASSSLTFPIRPTHKISKYSVDLSAVSSLLQKAFAELKVDPKNYHIQLSVPRVLNTNTQAELLRVLFDKFGVRSINLTHQSILALYAYNATSGIVVDVGERMDIVPVIDGYIVDGGVSRVPYGGYRILDHLRQFLYMRNISCINEVESYIIRQVLENICYCAHHYNTEKARCTKNPENFEKSVSLAEYCTKDWPYESISLDFGRFQATEGLFNPDAWGLDHPGLHKLVHKAIMECSMDIRKEMSRSIFLAGGVTQLPGLVDRLTTELDNLTPPAIRPKVHASPYRYHAAYIGACVLAESPAFTQSRISQEDWNKHGNSTLRKWSL